MKKVLRLIVLIGVFMPFITIRAAGLQTNATWIGEGDQAEAEFGQAVSAGDVNGDGYSDLVVGIPYFDGGETDEGRVAVYFGSASGPANTPSWTVESDQAGASFGWSVDAAGDVNHDGYADVVIGAPFYDNGQADEGRVYLYLGSATGVTATPVWTAESDQAGSHFGIMAIAGDVNGDGYADVIASAPRLSNGEVNEGAAYVYHGSASGLPASADWSVESDQAEAYLGTYIAGAGDVNGDGYEDVVVGAPYYDKGEADEGVAFAYYGSASGLPASADWTGEKNVAGATFGYAAASAGDVNGDGYADVIVGAPYFTNGEVNEGAAFVYHGSASGLSVSENWSAEGNQGGSFFGWAVSSAGRVNSDAYSAVLVGAPLYDGGETDEGAAFVYHGSASGLSTGANWSAEGDQAEAYFAYHLSSAGDVNGDGGADVIVGAPLAANGQTAEGRAFVYLGVPPSVPAPAAVGRKDLYPEEIELSIFQGECTTDRAIQLLVHAHNASKIKISNQPNLADAEWRAFDVGMDRVAVIDWTLPIGDGEKSVYIQLRSPFYDLTSDVKKATIRLDQTRLCHSADEHAHIVDAEGDVEAVQTNPSCLADFSHATVEPYLVGADGVKRGWRDTFVYLVRASAREAEYAFDGNGDGIYGDIVVHVERIGRKAFVHIGAIILPQPHDIRIRVDAADRGIIEDRLLWRPGQMVDEWSTGFDLAGYPELCESDLVPHPHAGDLLRGVASPIYVLGQDLHRHPFPNDEVFESWYPDGAEAMVVADYQLADIPLGRNVPLRPGSVARMPTGELCVVDMGQRLRPIITDALINFFFRTFWNVLIRRIGVEFMADYTICDPVVSESEFVALLNVTSTPIADLWPAKGVVRDPVLHAMNVLDGRVELIGDPYPVGQAEIQFRILGKDGTPFTAEDLNVAHTKRLHLILVRDDLTQFQHLHPLEDDGVWRVKADFPEEGRFTTYIDIAPVGERRVILRGGMVVGDQPAARTKLPVPDLSLAANDNPYRVELVSPPPVAGRELPLVFQLRKDEKPFADIRDHLAAYAHLVLLHHANPSVYVHTHPADDVIPSNGRVEFMARFPYSGRYTMFLQLNVAGVVRIFPLTLDVSLSSSKK